MNWGIKTILSPQNWWWKWWIFHTATSKLNFANIGKLKENANIESIAHTLMDMKNSESHTSPYLMILLKKCKIKRTEFNNQIFSMTMKIAIKIKYPHTQTFINNSK
jgi:hypothetical protein